MSVAKAGLVLVLVLSCALAPTHAHDSWISSNALRAPPGAPNAGEWCCGEGDCFIVPGKDVAARADGFHVTLRLIDGTDYRVEIVPYSEVRPLLIAQPEQVLAHDPDPFQKRIRIVLSGLKN
jgi:hypothetical protein